MKILVAIKNMEVLSALKIFINQNGHKDQVIKAITTKDFLKKLRSITIDMVLIDWDFFIGDTIEMITLLKKAYSNIKFIVLGIEKKNQKASLAANVDAFYLKSSSPKELMKLINSFRK